MYVIKYKNPKGQIRYVSVVLDLAVPVTIMADATHYTNEERAAEDAAYYLPASVVYEIVEVK